MIESGEELAEVVNSCNKILYVNNPIQNEKNRNKSREIMLEHLVNCQQTYRPSNLREITGKISGDVDKKNRLMKEKSELEKKRKEVSKKIEKGIFEDEKGNSLLILQELIEKEKQTEANCVKIVEAITKNT